MRYLGNPDYRHDSVSCTGILITNLGTPVAPTPKALRRYLGEFLADPRVVEMPRWLWYVILHGVILRIRPHLSAKAYKKVWTEDGSPLLHYSLQQHRALAEKFSAPDAVHKFGNVRVALGMRYGEPSMRDALRQLQQDNVSRILVLPLYPQYSATTTASTFDAVTVELKKWRWVPSLRFISSYHDYPAYIACMAEHLRGYWKNNPRGEKLLMSFHGLPKRYLLLGDPYYCHCHKTARLLAEQLGLDNHQWAVTFQSRFGREEWLQPYTDKTLQQLPQQEVKRVDVFCPGFSVDCLETLEEIAMQNKTFFMDAGGETFNYIPALNATTSHIETLYQLLTLNLQGWDNGVLTEDALRQSRKRASALGAKQ